MTLCVGSVQSVLTSHRVLHAYYHHILVAPYPHVSTGPGIRHAQSHSGLATGTASGTRTVHSLGSRV
eukprot:3021061-Rhodomonas_salina.1